MGHVGAEQFEGTEANGRKALASITDEMRTKALSKIALSVLAMGLWAGWPWPTKAAVNVYLTEVPDYAWNYGCMGTAAGNLMGFWDRHGFPGFYTGLANGGVAPLISGAGTISSLWVSKAGIDGRPADKPGHYDDYYLGYEDTGPDPYLTSGRTEHTPDCIADFIGMDQLKWTSMAGECNGNLDGFCFVYWNTNGDRRVNFTPDQEAGTPARDVQSGLRAWTQYRGHDCSVFTQLTDFNPNKPPSTGFAFEDMQNEIDAGYPVLLFLQGTDQVSRTIGSATNVNPEIHSMLAYGYYINDTGDRFVRYRTSWASGANMLSLWGPQNWQATLPVRGVIGYHPLPRIRQCSLTDQGLLLQWDGPASNLYDSATGATNRVHGYLVEMSTSLDTPNYSPVSPVLLTNTFTVTNCPGPAFFRVELVKP